MIILSAYSIYLYHEGIKLWGSIMLIGIVIYLLGELVIDKLYELGLIIAIWLSINSSIEYLLLVVLALYVYVLYSFILKKKNILRYYIEIFIGILLSFI